jgi:NADH:ubiquinone oxidoreductase subunit H
MGDENVEQLWYAFWLLKVIVSLSVLWAVALLCKWVLRRIHSSSARRRPPKKRVVHLLGTLKPPPNFNPSEGEVADRSGRKKGIG